MKKILKKLMRKVLLYCFVIVSIMILFLISSNNMLFAQEWEDEDEAKIVAEAQKDLAAILQWSVKYRFSPDLKVGDKVEYQLIGDPENKTDISLEVTKEEKDGIWIVEKFDDNEIHMLIDLKNMELIDFFGYDEDKKIPDPPMLTKRDMEKRIQVLNDFKKGLSIFGIPENWENTRNRENISTKFGNIECSIVTPKFDKDTSEELKENDLIGELKNKMNLYFSNEIPKMIPFEIAKYAIGCPDTYKQINGGFVKNSVVELKAFNK